MSINIRFPNITASTEREQIAQIRSYLHQLVEHLNYALPNLGTVDGSTQTVSDDYELRSLVIQEMQEVVAMFDKLSKKMQSDYVHKNEVASIVQQMVGNISFTLDEDGNLYYEVEE